MSVLVKGVAGRTSKNGLSRRGSCELSVPLSTQFKLEFKEHRNLKFISTESDDGRISSRKLVASLVGKRGSGQGKGFVLIAGW